MWVPRKIGTRGRENKLKHTKACISIVINLVWYPSISAGILEFALKQVVCSFFQLSFWLNIRQYIRLIVVLSPINEIKIPANIYVLLNFFNRFFQPQIRPVNSKFYTWIHLYKKHWIPNSFPSPNRMIDLSLFLLISWLNCNYLLNLDRAVPPLSPTLLSCRPPLFWFSLEPSTHLSPLFASLSTPIGDYLLSPLISISTHCWHLSLSLCQVTQSAIVASASQVLTSL